MPLTVCLCCFSEVHCISHPVEKILCLGRWTTDVGPDRGHPSYELGHIVT